MEVVIAPCPSTAQARGQPDDISRALHKPEEAKLLTGAKRSPILSGFDGRRSAATITDITNEMDDDGWFHRLLQGGSGHQ